MKTFKSKQFASGWVRQKKDGGEYIAAKADATRTKCRLILEDENGNQQEVVNFAVFFQEKTKEKAPDVSFVVSVE